MRLYLAGYALVAGWLAVSRLHRLHSSDSLIFSLASLYEWTPFFWEQDRVGLLLPLVVSPVRHPLANLLVLSGLTSLCGLLAPLLMARLVCPHRHAYAAVTVGNALMVAFGPDVLQENLFLTCVYPLALCLGLPAVGLLDRPTAGRVLAAAGLMVLAHWVYLGVAVFLLPLAGWRWLVRRSRRRLWAAVRVGLAVGLGLGVLLLAAAEWRRVNPGIMSTPSSKLPVADWPRSWFDFLDRLAELDRFGLWAAAVVGVAAAGGAVPVGRRSRPHAVRLVLPLGLAAVSELLLLGTRAWPAMNHHHPRYLLAFVTAGWTGVLLVGLLPVLRGRVSPRVSGGVAFALLAAAVGGRYGPPSLGAVQAELAALAGDDTAEVLASGADAVGGEYMMVWPATWHANLARYERGEPTPLVGVSARSDPWAWRWTAGPLRGGFRVAAPFDQEEQARRWLAHYRLDVTAGPARHGRLVVFTVVPAD